MAFETLVGTGVGAFVLGILSVLYFYLRASLKKIEKPSALKYFGIAALVTIGTYIIGAGVGIFIFCSFIESGNLCGLFGVFGVGPLVSGFSLLLYGYRYSDKKSD